jgi:hypothetical protein
MNESMIPEKHARVLDPMGGADFRKKIMLRRDVLLDRNLIQLAGS